MVQDARFVYVAVDGMGPNSGEEEVQEVCEALLAANPVIAVSPCLLLPAAYSSLLPALHEQLKERLSSGESDSYRLITEPSLIGRSDPRLTGREHDYPHPKDLNESLNGTFSK